MTKSIELEQAYQRVRAFKFKSQLDADWQRFFDDAVLLLQADDDYTKGFAVERFNTGLWSERRLKNYPARSPKKAPRIAALCRVPRKRRYAIRFEGLVPLRSSERLRPLLIELETQTQFEQLVTGFTKYLAASECIRKVVGDWLKDLSKRGQAIGISGDAVLIGLLHLGDYPKNNWKEAQGVLFQYFSHTNDLVRAAAAAAVGNLYTEGELEDLPPIDEMMEIIRQYEIERPGVAGPFWGEIQFDFEAILKNDGVEFDVTKWMLEIIAQRHGEEPDVHTYNGIDFYAHEMTAGNRDAIKTLIELGEDVTAALAATEIDYSIEEIKEILIELGSSSNDFVARVCCWHLAYHYDYLHPEGEKRGFVKLEPRSNVHVYLVFSKEGEAVCDSPYAATIYPNGGRMDDSTAWSWISKIAPKEDIPPGKRPYDLSCERTTDITYEFGATFVHLYGVVKNKEWDRVWIKWPKNSGW